MNVREIIHSLIGSAFMSWLLLYSQSFYKFYSSNPDQIIDLESIKLTDLFSGWVAVAMLIGAAVNIAAHADLLDSKFIPGIRLFTACMWLSWPIAFALRYSVAVYLGMLKGRWLYINLIQLAMCLYFGLPALYKVFTQSPKTSSTHSKKK
jgi:hypothetical protein